MGLLDILNEFTEEEIDNLVDAIFRGQVSVEFEEELIEAIQEADPTLREDLVAEMEAFGRLEDVLPGVERSQPPVGPLPGIPEEEEPAIRERTQAERETRQRLIDLIEANVDDVEVLLDIARALEQREAAISGLFSQDRIDTLSEMDLEELVDRAREAARTAKPLELEDFPALERALRRGGGRDVSYFENIIAELEGDRRVQTLRRQGVDTEAVAEIREMHPNVVDEAVAVARQNISDLRGPPAPAVEEVPEIERPQVGRPALGRQEPFVDESYISGEEIVRDPGFEEWFVTLAVELGRARDFSHASKSIASRPEEFFQLTAAEQRRFFDATPESWLRRWINEDVVTESQLLDRGFSEDDIADRP